MRVNDSDAASWLADPERRRWLFPFVGKERTLAEIGRELDVPVNAVLYRARLLVKHGLIRVVGEERRRGRAMKRYAAAADGFIVPVSLVPVATLEGLLALNELRAQEALTRELARAVHRLADPARLVLRIGVDQFGVLGAGLALDGREFDLAEELSRASAPALWSSWSTLSLSDDEAKSLQRELVELWRRYQGGSAPTSYTLRLALVPERKR
jgi:DNA-binding transcriptional ArsR family regulator